MTCVTLRQPCRSQVETLGDRWREVLTAWRCTNRPPPGGWESESGSRCAAGSRRPTRGHPRGRRTGSAGTAHRSRSGRPAALSTRASSSPIALCTKSSLDVDGRRGVAGAPSANSSSGADRERRRDARTTRGWPHRRTRRCARTPSATPARCASSRIGHRAPRRSSRMARPRRWRAARSAELRRWRHRIRLSDGDIPEGLNASALISRLHGRALDAPQPGRRQRAARRLAAARP